MLSVNTESFFEIYNPLSVSLDYDSSTQIHITIVNKCVCLCGVLGLELGT